MKTYAVDEGTYPVNALYPCLGDAGTSCGANPGFACFGSGNPTGQLDLENKIKKVVTTLPAVSTQRISCNNSGGIISGVYYNSADGKSAIIGYYLKGNVQCGQAVGLTIYSQQQAGDATACAASLPTIP